MSLSAPPALQAATAVPAGAPTHHIYDEASILKDFLRDMAYVPPTINGTNGRLEAAMREEMESRSLQCDQLEKTIHLAASLIELAYHDFTFAEKKNIALFNWHMMYVDDMASRDLTPSTMFEQRFLSGQPQLDPVLDALVEVLRGMWKQYEPLCANSIMVTVFEFFTFNYIERAVEKMPLVRGAHRFPWFLPDRTGISPAFALMLFTKGRNVNILEYIQGVPDMNYWISVTNDLLSFHEEELAGEKTNYIHTRAYVENKVPLQVLAEIGNELASSKNVIHAALAHNPQALRAWQAFERGYIGWHLAQERYELKDLGF